MTTTASNYKLLTRTDNHDTSILGSNNHDTEMVAQETQEKRKTKNYTEYSDKEREMFFDYKLQHLMSTRGAAKKLNIKPSTAQKWWDNYLEDPDNYVVGKKTNRQNRKPAALNDEHKEFLTECFDENPQAFIVDAVENLTKKFEGLDIKKSRVNEFMKHECNLSFKQVHFWPEARSSQENIAARKAWVEKWQHTDLDYTKNCVFIDEAGFNINLKANRAWGPKGKKL